MIKCRHCMTESKNKEKEQKWMVIKKRKSSAETSEHEVQSTETVDPLMAGNEAFKSRNGRKGIRRSVTF